MSKRSRLAIIGAGPKALAIATKAHVLSELGFLTPEIWIFERNEVGSHWDGNHGYTNGRLPLGTSPEKDIGFPYFSYSWGDEVNSHVNQRMIEYSWQTFLVEQNQFSDWIDRGRPPPEHRKWASYLRWIFQKIREQVEFIQEEVVGLHSDLHSTWKLTTQHHQIQADGVVVTGPGHLKGTSNSFRHPRVFTLETFWQNLEKIQGIPQNSHIAVVGSGETAASMVLFLGHLRTNLAIDLIVPSAMSYSRGESYVENHVYTDPFKSNWITWTLEDREKFIQRTDRGVFSVSSKRFLDQWEFVEIIPGSFQSIHLNSNDQLVLDIIYNQESEKRVYDYVALSLGFDPWSQVLSWLDPQTLACLQSKLKMKSITSEGIELQIDEDLSIKNLEPRLHIPMLAGLCQGPGFGNLSCLGRLSDQILQSYVSLDFSSNAPDRSSRPRPLGL